MPTTSAAERRAREEEERTGIFAVGEILDEKFEDDGTDTNKINLYYLVHWKHWPKSDDSWEPQENLQGSKAVLKRWAEKKLASTKGPARSKKSVSPVRALGNRRPLPVKEDSDDSTSTVEDANPPNSVPLGTGTGTTGSGDYSIKKSRFGFGDAVKEPVRLFSSWRTETAKSTSYATGGTLPNPTLASVGDARVPSTERAYTPRYVPPREFQVPDWTLEDYLSLLPFLVVAVVVLMGIASIFTVK